MDLEKGDLPGHPFRGNQHTDAFGGTRAEPASDRAIQASLAASAASKKAKTPEQYGDVARMHQRAAAAHAKAAVAMKWAGRKQAAKEHERIMRGEVELMNLNRDAARTGRKK